MLISELIKKTIKQQFVLVSGDTAELYVCERKGGGSERGAGRGQWRWNGVGNVFEEWLG